MHTQDDLNSIWLILMSGADHASILNQEAAAMAVAATVTTNNDIAQAFTLPTIVSFNSFDNGQHVDTYERTRGNNKEEWGLWSTGGSAQ